MGHSRESIVRIAGLLAWQDIKQAYRRSALGQFWITMGMSVQILTIGVVFGMVLDAPAETYLPFVATGVIVWTFFSTTLNEASTTFVNSESLLRQLTISPITYIFRTVWKSFLVFLHNLALIPVVIILFGQPLTSAQLLFLPGLILTLISLFWVSIFLSIIGTRFRDIPPIVSSLLTVGFYVTPVIWRPESIPGDLAHLLLGLNPLYHLMQIMRLPLLGEFPTIQNWLVALLSCTLGSLAGYFFYRANKYKIVYWL
jgi:lipopolysaccharide transport system permease protein